MGMSHYLHSLFYMIYSTRLSFSKILHIHVKNHCITKHVIHIDYKFYLLSFHANKQVDDDIAKQSGGFQNATKISYINTACFSGGMNSLTFFKFFFNACFFFSLRCKFSSFLKYF